MSDQEEKKKTKICKYCKSEIPADAKICPHCRKKQKGGKLKWIIIAVIVIIIIAAAAGSGGDDSPKKVEGGSQSSTTSASGNTDGNEQEDNESDASTFTIGDTADFDGIQVTLSSAVLSDGDGQYITPDDGKYFLILTFSIDNQSEEDISVSSLASFEAYCDDNSINEDLMGQQVPEAGGLDQLDGDVASGKKMNGIISYEVPRDFSTFEVRFTPSFWKDNEAVFTFSRDDVDSSSVQ